MLAVRLLAGRGRRTARPPERRNLVGRIVGGRRRVQLARLNRLLARAWAWLLSCPAEGEVVVAGARRFRDVARFVDVCRRAKTGTKSGGCRVVQADLPAGTLSPPDPP